MLEVTPVCQKSLKVNDYYIHILTILTKSASLYEETQTRYCNKQLPILFQAKNYFLGVFQLFLSQLPRLPAHYSISEVSCRKQAAARDWQSS